MTVAGGAVATLPLSAFAQQAATPVIGFLNGSSAIAWVRLVAEFVQGVNESGFIEGESVVIEYRWADGQYDRLPALAADLVRRQVTVIVATGGPPSIVAAMAATKTIPIVFTSGADPVAHGFVESVGRPGGNATGVTLFTNELIAKRIELLREAVPKATTVALLINPNNPNAEFTTKNAQAAARALGLRVFITTARSERDLEAAFIALDLQQAVALVVVTDPLFENQRARLAALAMAHAIPAIFPWREDAVAGGLISYGTSIINMYRQAGLYTGKILRGEQPAELPVLQPTTFELVVNLRTAKALGIAIPESILARADEVIE